MKVNKPLLFGLIGGGTALLLLCCCSGIGVTFFVVRPLFSGQTIYSGRNALTYKSPVTEEEAIRLVAFLVKEKFFTAERESKIRVNKNGPTYQFHMPVKTGLDRDERTVIGLRLFSHQLSREVFNGSPVDIHMCDENWKTLRVVVR